VKRWLRVVAVVVLAIMPGGSLVMLGLFVIRRLHSLYLLKRTATHARPEQIDALLPVRSS